MSETGHPSGKVTEQLPLIVLFVDTDEEINSDSCVCCGDFVHPLEKRWVEEGPIHWQCLKEVNSGPVTPTE